MIEQRHRDWIAAVNATDIDAYAHLVTEDLVWMPPDGEAVVGRAALGSWLEPFFGAFTYEFGVEDVRVRTTDRWIAETGQFTSRMTPKAGGAAATHGGRYFILWRRDDDDAWRIERYVDQGSLRTL